MNLLSQSSKNLLFLIIFTFVISNAKPQGDAIWNGHIAFGDGRYDNAITEYNLAISKDSKWSWLPEIIETAEKRKLLGSITPNDTHFIGAIFVTELNIHKDTGGVVRQADVTQEQKEKWQVIFNLTTQVIQSFSDGNWSIEFDTISTVSTYRESAELMPDNPDHLDLEKYFFEGMHRFDSYITFSNTRSPARGLARSYPVVHGALYGPHRGMAAINAGTHDFSILLHEFFHIIEWISNAIKITHGYRTVERDSFPDWVGDTEYDYYRWQFSDTLADIGWDKLNHRLRWIPFKWSAEEYQNIQSEYNGISLDDRRLANVLCDSATAMKADSLELAILLFEQSIALSPYHEKALIELKEYYELIKVDTAEAGKHYHRLNQIREVNDYYFVYDETKELGEVIALWHREDMSEEGRVFEWDVTDYLDDLGNYQVTFYYTHGWKGVEIDSVFFFEGNLPLVWDIHDGWSGKTKTDNVYELISCHVTPGKRYKIKVRLTSLGGTDSWGQVHMKYVGDIAGVSTNKIDGEYNIYPNPAVDYLNLSSKSVIQKIEIFTVTGRKVLADQNNLSYFVKVDISGFTKGLYIIKTITPKGVFIKEFIKN